MFLTRNSDSDVVPGARCDVVVSHQMALSSVFHLRHVRHFTFRYLQTHNHRHCRIVYTLISPFRLYTSVGEVRCVYVYADCSTAVSEWLTSLQVVILVRSTNIFSINFKFIWFSGVCSLIINVESRSWRLSRRQTAGGWTQLLLNADIQIYKFLTLFYC